MPKESFEDITQNKSEDEQKEKPKGTRIDLPGGKYMEVIKTGKGEFEVVDENITDKSHAPDLGVSSARKKDISFKDQQPGSDAELLGMSRHFEVGKVEFDLPKIKARSIKEIEEAVKKIKFKEFDQGDL